LHFIPCPAIKRYSLTQLQKHSRQGGLGYSKKAGDNAEIVPVENLPGFFKTLILGVSFDTIPDAVKLKSREVPYPCVPNLLKNWQEEGPKS
jgi:hypothetical protein